jgi:hypothetical protein
MARFFTPEEANDLLPQVRPLVEAMVRARAKLATAEEAHTHLGRSIRRRSATRARRSSS